MPKFKSKSYFFKYLKYQNDTFENDKDDTMKKKTKLNKQTSETNKHNQMYRDIYVLTLPLNTTQ